MNRRKMSKGVVAIVVVCLALAACSGGGSKGSTSLSVTTTDFAFAPNAFTIPAGKEISLSLTNNGKVEHEFVILKTGTSVTAPFDDDDEPKVFWEGEVEAGKTETFKFTAPAEAGTYSVVCGLPQHFEAGMIATLTVVK